MNQFLFRKAKALMVILVSSLLLVYGCADNHSGENISDKDKGSTADSLDIISGMIKQDSSNYQLFARRARMHLEKGQIDPAFRDLNYAIDINPDDPNLFILLGDVYFIIGKKENCLASYRKAGELDPKSLTPVLKLAETHLILQEYQAAQRFIEIALNLDVNSAKAYYLKGIQRMETGDTTNALLNLKIAGNLDPTYYEAFMQTGAIYTALRDTTAIEYYRAALKAIPDEERALFLLAVTYQDKGDFDQALEIYRRINELYPANKVAFYNTGYIDMVELMDFETAKKAFRSAILIDPSYVEAVYNLGRIYEETGDYSEARNQYKQALELQTNYPLAVDGLNRLDELQSVN